MIKITFDMTLTYKHTYSPPSSSSLHCTESWQLHLPSSSLEQSGSALQVPPLQRDQVFSGICTKHQQTPNSPVAEELDPGALLLCCAMLLHGHVARNSSILGNDWRKSYFHEILLFCYLQF